MNESKEELYRTIRDVIAVDPNISTRSLQKFLNSKGYPIKSDKTVQTYRNKVETAIVMELDMTKVIERLSTMNERLRMTFSRLQRIAFWDPEGREAKAGMPPPAYRDQINALRTMMSLDVLVFKTQRAAGVFKKVMSKDEELQQRFKPLPSEAREKIINALKNWGFYPGSEKDKEPDVYYDSDTETVTGEPIQPVALLESKQDLNYHGNHPAVQSVDDRPKVHVDVPGTVRLSPFAAPAKPHAPPKPTMVG